MKEKFADTKKRFPVLQEIKWAKRRLSWGGVMRCCLWRIKKREKSMKMHWRPCSNHPAV